MHRSWSALALSVLACTGTGTFITVGGGNAGDQPGGGGRSAGGGTSGGAPGGTGSGGITGAGGELGGNAGAPGPAGPNPALAALERFEDLPLLKLTAHPQAFSSVDPQLKNDDRNKYLYAENGEQVMFDAEGPGVLTRWWHTGDLSGEYHVYFDGEKTPRLKLVLWEFWQMKVAPFLEPITLNDYKSSGGFVSYYPMAFAKSLKITFAGNKPHDYYNFNYSRYSDRTVPTFTGTESMDRVISLFKNAGQNPIAAGDSDVKAGGTADLGGGATSVLASLTGPGEIVGMILTVPNSAPGKPVPLTGARLQIFWDGQSAPAVDAPVPEFFGMFSGRNVEVRSLPVGHVGDRFYCYFPMPFATSAKVQLINAAGAAAASVGYEIVSRPLAADFKQLGYFHALANAVAATTKDKDYLILSVQGSGHYVGMNMVFPNSGVTLEGNDRMFVDGSKSPTINGTGTEDYFNGGWYFMKGAFTTATHGAPTLIGMGNGGMPFNAYRFHIADVIPFASSIVVSIQHGEQNGNMVPYSSVAYFYLNPKVRSVRSDALDIGDGASAAQHQYTAPGANGAPITGRFMSDDPMMYTRAGRTLTGPSSFTVKIDPENQGVTLRRLLDQSMGRQTASVSVDDTPVGNWKTLETNPTFRWREDDFWIPPGVTKGKDHITVKIAPGGMWNEFGYTVFSVLPP
jgi:hypothetical protein